MKTLLFALVLLMAACSSNAMPSLFSTAPRSCCFQFSSISLPLKHVSSIVKTHRTCPKTGFIVQTVRKRKICYRENFKWALDVYYHLQNTEGIRRPQ